MIRHSNPILILLFLLISLINTGVFPTLVSVVDVSHSALCRSLDTSTLGITANCHLPNITILSIPWQNFVIYLILYVLSTPQCLE